MTDPAALPLTAASARLRGAPGRPRLGTVGAQSTPETRMNGGPGSSGHDSQSGRPPRLLDVPATAHYLGLTDDTVRELDASGVLASARVRIPGTEGRALRRVLFDVIELDRLIDGWRNVS